MTRRGVLVAAGATGVLLAVSPADPGVATDGEGRIADLTAGDSVQTSHVYRNGTVPGAHSGSIVLRAVKDVEVPDTLLWSDGQAGNTLVLMSALAGAPGPDSRSSGVRLSGIDVRNSPVTWTGGESESGEYDMAGSGSPNSCRGAGLAAPLGSRYTDTATGRRYLKTAGPLVITGWNGGRAPRHRGAGQGLRKAVAIRGQPETWGEMRFRLTGPGL
ncbi:hypothetical protein ACWD0A_00885 [Streptomyces sp. NPDC002867]